MSDEAVKKEELVEEVPRIGPDGKLMPKEYGGTKGLEPTRHGEWEVNGRVVDF